MFVTKKRHDQIVQELMNKIYFLEHRIDVQVKMIEDRKRDQSGRYASHYEGDFN
jgi:hypothetical protein